MRRATRHVGLAAAAAALVLLLAGCNAERMVRGISQALTTDEGLAKKGAATHQEIIGETPIYDQAALSAYVDKVGQRVARAAGPPGATYRFYVLDSSEVNAFAIPGGYIYVLRGLLDLLQTEDQLAAVLGHELAHLTTGHAASQARARGGSEVLGSAAQTGVVLLGVVTFNPLLMMGGVLGGDAAADTLTAALSAGYSREKELEADRLGMDYAVAAGYSPKGSVQSIQSIQNEVAWSDGTVRAQGYEPLPTHGIFASHPDNVQRVQAMQARAAQVSAKPLAPEDDYLKRLDGTRFGDANRLGIQRGERFYDGFHQWTSVVPSGWFVSQSPEQRLVVFNAPQSVATILFSSQDLAEDMSAESFVKTYMSGARFEGKTRTLAGRPVWRGTADVGKGKTVYEVMAWTDAAKDQERGYLVLGLRNPPKNAGKNAKSTEAAPTVAWPQTFDTFGNGLRPMRADEAGLADSPTIRITVADGTQRYAQLAKGAALGRHAEPQLRIINAQYPSGEPAKGQRIKVFR